MYELILQDFALLIKHRLEGKITKTLLVHADPGKSPETGNLPS